MPKITMRERIGLTAGAIWDVLGKKHEVSLTQLSKLIKEKPLVVQQALGWLARENKITFREAGEKVYIALAEAERR